METKHKVKIIDEVFEELDLHSMTYKGACLNVVNRIEKLLKKETS